MRTEAKIALYLFTTVKSTGKIRKVLDLSVAGAIMSQDQKARVEKFLDRLAAAS
jgi:diphthamide synthase (EF-2-diphthine--ammonia ligase)